MVDLGAGSDIWGPPAHTRRRGWSGVAASVRTLMERRRASVGRVDQAHARRCRAEAVTDDTVSDVRRSRDDILGEPTWQADLPFFMQRGFR